MQTGSSVRRLTVATLIAVMVATLSSAAEAQVPIIGRRANLALLCGGGSVLGFKLGDRVAKAALARTQLSPADAEKMRLSIKIGTAAAACGTSVLLANTIYGKLSERDKRARKREMEAALEDAEPGTRQYILPDSGLRGTLETLPAEQDDRRECRLQLDTLGEESEPVSARWCRKSASDSYEIDLG